MLIDLDLMPVFLAAVLLLMITPGPDMIFVTANALGGGRKAGMASLMGVATGAWLHICLAAAGLSAVIVASPLAYEVVRFGGALYLAYVGVKFLLSKEALGSIRPAGAQALGAIYRQGVITNLLNPKAALFTLSFVPQFVAPDLGPVWAQMLVLGLVIVAVMIVVDLPIVLASGRFAEWLGQRQQASRRLGQGIGLVLIGLAAWVAFARRQA